jgi:alpha-tubulin suppressor-like RCC1 family protein
MLVLMDNQDVFAFGDNRRGQVGVGTKEKFFEKPQRVHSLTKRGVKQVSQTFIFRLQFFYLFFQLQCKCYCLSCLRSRLHVETIIAWLFRLVGTCTVGATEAADSWAMGRRRSGTCHPKLVVHLNMKELRSSELVHAIRLFSLVVVTCLLGGFQNSVRLVTARFVMNVTFHMWLCERIFVFVSLCIAYIW